MRFLARLSHVKLSHNHKYVEISGLEMTAAEQYVSIKIIEMSYTFEV